MTRREKNRKARPRHHPTETASDEGLRFTRWTGIFGGLGVAFAGLGFYLLSQEWINVAPVLLIIGFLVFFPLALIR